MKNNPKNKNGYTPSQADQKTRDCALGKAMETYGEYLIRFFTRKIGDRQRSEELAMSLWRHAYETFPVEKYDSLGLLLFAANQTLCREYRRMRARKDIKTVALRPEDHDLFAPRNFESEDAEKRVKERFWEIFEGLELLEDHKEAFWLNVIHGYKMNELSEHFGVSRSAVSDWINKLKKKCRKHLKGE